MSSGTLALEQISPKQPKLRSRPINPIITGVNIEVYFGQPIKSLEAEDVLSSFFSGIH
jgi:hypothetical protein